MDGRSAFFGLGTRCARLLVGAVFGVSAGCAGGGGPVAGPGDSSGSTLPTDLPHLMERAALLYLVDRQLYEPVLVREGLAGPPELRRETALALGRIGDPGGLETLYSLLADEVPEVRREAAFALGEVAEAPATAGSARTRAAARLLEAVDDPDRETGRLAVEALGKAGVTVRQVAGALGSLPEEEVRARLLPGLFRYPEEAAVPLAAEGLAADDPALRRWAAYALTRRPRPEALPWIRELTADPDPRVRAWAARAIGLVGGEAGTGPRDLALLRPLLDDRDGHPGATIQALRAARALVADGRSAPDPGWKGPLLRLFAHPRVGVRVTALDAASAWLLDDELGDALASVAAGERPASDGAGSASEPSVPSAEEHRPPGAWERGTALVALATGGDRRAEALAATAARSADPWLRARAAEAAGVLGARHLLEELAGDPEPRVRQAAGAARLALAAGSGGADGPAGEPGAAEVAREALGDPDPGVRAAALGWLADRPVLPLEELEAALGRARRSPVVEEPLAAVDALAARAEAESGERGAIVTLLETVATQAEYPVRLRAAAALERLGRPRPPVGPVEAERPLGVYQTILVQTAEPRTLAVATERGDLRIRLACPEVPLTCLSLLQLVRQRFYDGLTFHRVVPDFVVQGGDPRGDGWGGPGYTLRDEVHRLRFDRGVVGMALAGPDTGGSQLFVALGPQPHLDGAYAAVGEVVAGEEVLDRIQPGDRILEIREVEERRRRP